MEKRGRFPVPIPKVKHNCFPNEEVRENWTLTILNNLIKKHDSI